MDVDSFRRHAHELVDWMADYLQGIERFPVSPGTPPREVIRQLPDDPPEAGEPFATIFDDFQRIILPGMTHWQHPYFFGYFPANSSPPSVLAEMLTATLAAQCMNWVTSPAATELEERMMDWLARMTGLPSTFTGVIQDTASTASLCAILTARERFAGFTTNASGLQHAPLYTAYGSTETHSSISKGLRIAGLGSDRFRTLSTDGTYAIVPGVLEEAIVRDRDTGQTPLIVFATLGTTGSTAIDPLRPIADICRRHEVWLHVDAAFAGSALILPECRWMSEGIELADSVVMNPHKWLLTNFDCSAYFVRDPDALVSTMSTHPEYLRTQEGDQVRNYRDWGIQLGRRFRALKLWFVIRSYGVEGLREVIRGHIRMAKALAEQISASPDFEMLAPVPLSLVCFRYRPAKQPDGSDLDALNARLLASLNATGRIFLTHTVLGGRYTLRLAIGQMRVRNRHVEEAWSLIQAHARAVR